MNKILFLIKLNDQNSDVLRRDVSYIRKVLQDNDFQVDVYDYKKSILLANNQSKQVGLSVNCLGSGFSLFVSFINFIYFLFIFKKKYNYLHIFSVREEYLLLYFLIRLFSQKLLITFFGSDLNKSSFIKNNFKGLYKIPFKGTVSTESFKKVALKLLKKGEENNLHVLLLPQPQLLLYLPFKLEDKIAFKKKLGLEHFKYVLVIGTCIHENEQHKKIIDQLITIKNPSDYHLIFPFSSKWENLEALQNEIEEYIKYKLSNFSFKIYKDFISDELMRDLRFASDYFINLREYDQFNAAMIECNLSCTEIITGRWLPYEHYANDFKINIINTFDQLVEKLHFLQNESTESIKKNLAENRNKAIEKYMPEANPWLLLYQS